MRINLIFILFEIPGKTEAALIFNGVDCRRGWNGRKIEYLKRIGPVGNIEIKLQSCPGWKKENSEKNSIFIRALISREDCKRQVNIFYNLQPAAELFLIHWSALKRVQYLYMMMPT